MQALIIIILIVAILLVVFTLQNSVEITIQLFFWEIPNAPLVLVLIFCLALGYIVALVYIYPRFWKLKRKNNQLIKFNEELKELHTMNNPEKKDNNELKENGNHEGDKMDSFDRDSFFND